jgi:hypothetical protein
MTANSNKQKKYFIISNRSFHCPIRFNSPNNPITLSNKPILNFLCNIDMKTNQLSAYNCLLVKKTNLWDHWAFKEMMGDAKIPQALYSGHIREEYRGRPCFPLRLVWKVAHFPKFTQ